MKSRVLLVLAALSASCALPSRRNPFDGAIAPKLTLQVTLDGAPVVRGQRWQDLHFQLAGSDPQGQPVYATITQFDPREETAEVQSDLVSIVRWDGILWIARPDSATPGQTLARAYDENGPVPDPSDPRVDWVVPIPGKVDELVFDPGSCIEGVLRARARERVLRDGVPYEDLGPQHLDGIDRARVTKRLIKRLTDLGLRVEVQPAVA